MITILAVTADKRQQWVSIGHTVELAKESYANNWRKSDLRCTGPRWFEIGSQACSSSSNSLASLRSRVSKPSVNQP